MAIIPIGFSQVNLIFTGPNVPLGAECTFGVENAGAPPTNVGNDVITALNSSTLMTNFIDDETITSVHVKNGPNATGAASQVAANVPGGSASSGVSPQVSALFKKHTNLGGRMGSGRMFWPGLTEAAIGSDGVIDSGVAGAIQTDLNAFLTALLTNGVPMYLLHNDSTAPTEVIGLTVDTRAATQRRRLRR